jgi:hypothetical protein
VKWGERRDLRGYRSHDGGVTLPDLSIAYAAQHAAEERLATYAAAPGMAVRRGRDWFAVRTGVDSNEMNGVVSVAQAEISADLVEDLVGWFRAGAVSASWLTTRPDPQLRRTLLAAGARADRSGHWSAVPCPLRHAHPMLASRWFGVVADTWFYVPTYGRLTAAS